MIKSAFCCIAVEGTTLPFASPLKSSCVLPRYHRIVGRSAGPKLFSPFRNLVSATLLHPSFACKKSGCAFLKYLSCPIEILACVHAISSVALFLYASKSTATFFVSIHHAFGLFTTMNSPYAGSKIEYAISRSGSASSAMPETVAMPEIVMPEDSIAISPGLNS